MIYYLKKINNNIRMTNNIFDVIVYHKNCSDGIASAWIAKKYVENENVELLPIFAGKDPVDLVTENKNILFVDI